MTKLFRVSIKVNQKEKIIQELTDRIQKLKAVNDALVNEKEEIQ